MAKKLPYEEPKLLFIDLKNSDIITTSGPDNGIEKDEGENDGEWT